MSGYHPVWGWDTPARASLPKVVATPPKKPRARQLRNGRWWIHTGDPRQPFVVGATLPEAWVYWLQLCERGAV